jgi:hypothetical protein
MLAVFVQVVVMFLASFLAGSLANQLQAFIKDPASVLTVLGTGVPQTASFFLVYILFNVRPAPCLQSKHACAARTTIH